MNASPTDWEVASSVAILVLASTSCLLGLFRDGHYAEPAGELLRIHAQDVVILVIGVPVLAASLLYATRGSVRGRVAWLGSLAFMTYMWTHYAFVVAYNEFFLGYVALFALSMFTLISGSVRTDAIAIGDAARGVLPERVYAGFLAVAAVGLAVMWLSDILPALSAGTLPSAIDQLGDEAAYTYVVDLGVLVPALAISARWLWRKQRWGYVFTGVLLVFAALVAPVLTAITVVDLYGGIEISAPILIGTIAPPLLGVVFAGAYLATLPSDPS